MPESIYGLKIFHGFDKEIVDSIINNCEQREYSLGELIIVEGENSNGEGYILKKGKVTISIGGQRVAELNPGDIFGEIALLNEEARTATVSALSNIEVIVLNLSDLINIINNDANNINKLIIQRIEENLKLD
ncbi:MAG: cyclic nucleotide-binding domain-containing protein [Candidatus Gracilibacteria bacterium]|nr:cyclic nucleotide-binding domain-containing protein [Candidatus Gracilibacteria bacterium]